MSNKIFLKIFLPDSVQQNKKKISLPDMSSKISFCRTMSNKIFLKIFLPDSIQQNIKKNLSAGHVQQNLFLLDNVQQNFFLPDNVQQNILKNLSARHVQQNLFLPDNVQQNIFKNLSAGQCPAKY